MYMLPKNLKSLPQLHYIFQFESQDVLIPWHRPSTTSTSTTSHRHQGSKSSLMTGSQTTEGSTSKTSHGGTTTTTSEDDVTHYHAYSQTASDSSADVKRPRYVL